MIFAVSTMAGWLVSPAQAEHLAFGLVLRPTARCAAAAGTGPVHDVIDEAIDGHRGGRQEEAESPRADARPSVGRSNRRAEIRRPVDGSRQGLHLRLGRMLSFDGDASPYLYSTTHARICSPLPAGPLTAPRCGRGAKPVGAPGAAFHDACAGLRHGRRRSGRRARSPSPEHVPVRLASDFTASTSTAPCCGPGGRHPGESPGVDDVTARYWPIGLYLFGIEAPGDVRSRE